MSAVVARLVLLMKLLLVYCEVVEETGVMLIDSGSGSSKLQR